MAFVVPKNCQVLLLSFSLTCLTGLIAYIIAGGRGLPLIIFISLLHFVLRAGCYKLLSRAPIVPILWASLLGELVVLTDEFALLYVANTGLLTHNSYGDYLYAGIWLVFAWMAAVIAFRAFFPKSATVRNLLLLLIPSAVLLLLVIAVVYGLNHGYLHK